MNLQEAYNLIGVPSSSSQDEVKKKYRELSKKYHPDVNKDPGSEDHFKKINEAYARIQSGEPDNQPGFGFPFQNNRSNINDFINFQSFIQQSRPIDHNIEISFKDSVFGTKMDLSYHRQDMCKPCSGTGSKSLNNCTTCNGSGRVVKTQGQMMIVTSCPTCNGNSPKENCTACNHTGKISLTTTINLTIPGGIVNGNVLRLQGIGNFAGVGGMFQGPMFGDVHVHVKVIEEPGLKLEGRDVVTDVKLSLLESLEGCKKSVKTVNGDMEISIPSKIKNKDVLTLPNLGVEKIGNQRVNVDVDYPENINDLILFLKQKEI